METRKSYNIVHNDEIWKDHIHREIIAQTKWPEKWGFLSDIYKELQQSSEKFQRTKEMPDQPDETSTAMKEQGKSFPKTSAQMIGWKSAKTSSSIYGIPDTRARGKCDVLRVLQWPHEGL